MRPHEESWVAEDDYLYLVGEDGERVRGVLYGAHYLHMTQAKNLGLEMPGDAEPEDAARVLLAACAPELVRMLLEHEWTVGEAEFCMTCFQSSIYGHESGCAYEALLRKAGVR